MKTLISTTAAAALFAVALSAARAQDMPKMPGPEKEHEWLQQLVGKWQTDGEMTPEPGKPSIKCKGTEATRSIGSFWVLAEVNGSFVDTPMTAIMALGYDPEKQKFVGTWVDSMSSHLWTYEGTLDPSGKVLTLESEGPCPFQAGRLTKFKDTIELKDKDHRVLTSSMLGDDGKWITVGTVKYERTQ